MDVPAGSSIVRFGQFEADLRTGELRKGGLRVRLQDKPFRLLAALLERPGEVVTREELQRRLWPADTFVDFDNSLNNAVNRVRAALGDSAENARFVETVGRRGYRFIAPVEPTEPGGTPVTASPAAAASAGRAVERPRARILIWGAVAAAVVLAGVVAFLGVRTRTVTSEAVSSLAVLPLTNDSAGSDDYFADGMTDALITELARLRAVRVISRTSVMGYRGTTKRLPEIARELGVDGIVEGSVLRSGERIRITAQLVDARTDTHLWAETYHRDVRDVLSLQSEVARAVANAVSATLTDASPLPPARPVDPAAFDLYLRGRSACTMRQPPATVRHGIDQLQQAIARDPEYAQAHAGLATCYSVLGTLLLAQPPADTRPLAAAAARRAIALDGRLAEAHARLAMMNTRDWRWAEAEAGFRRALELSPSDSRARSEYAKYLAARGRTDEAVAEVRRAEALDPLSLDTRTDAGWMLQLAARHEEAIRKFQSVLDVDSGYAHARWLAALSMMEVGRLDQAIDWFGIAERATGSPSLTAWRAQALARAGRTGEAREALGRLLERESRTYVPPAPVAFAFAALGDTETAFAWLERGFAERSTVMAYLGLYRFVDPLRGDPRFADLLRRMGISDLRGPARPPRQTAAPS